MKGPANVTGRVSARIARRGPVCKPFVFSIYVYQVCVGLTRWGVTEVEFLLLCAP